MKCCLTIAGSDCSGGAGIQADLKTFAAHGVYGMSVIVSVVAENTRRVLSIRDLEPSCVSDQLDAVFEDLPVHAVKVGMLSSAPLMETVAEKLRQYAPAHVVLDPVMVAKGGCALMQPQALQTLRQKLLPLATLVTPNLPEAAALTGLPVETPGQMEEAARALCGLGANCALVKGGHLKGDALDLLYDGAHFCSFSHPRLDTKNTHGTGCTLSSAIAANLALGLSLEQAVAAGKDYVTQAIRHALPLGHGSGPTNHLFRFFPE